MKPLFIVLIITSVIIVVFLLFLFYVYSRIFWMNKKEKKRAQIFDVPFGKEHKDVVLGNTKKLESISHQDVYVKSFDGKILHGFYYHINDNSPLEIGFHGYKGQAFRDFSGGALFALEKGFNLLLVEERAHGMSGGSTITFGIKERKDVLTWINYANIELNKNHNPILLTGISMGAATVLMASNLALPNNVKGIIADCPYTSPIEIIGEVLKKMKLSPKILYPFVCLSAFLFGHFRIKEESAENAVKSALVPILLIHGENDNFVPFEMGKKIAEASKKIEFHAFPNADHGCSYLEDPKRYIEIVNEFIDRVIYGG